MEKSLVVGLGNPGKTYERTRHNIGFAAVDLLASHHRLEFHKRLKWKGALASGPIGRGSVYVLKPLTFMNFSGEAVAEAIRLLQIELSRFLVLVDDVALPLGQLRLRTNSGAGGHKGLQSIEEHLQTNRYARLRIGVGDREEGELADHVLGRFTREEEELLPEILKRAVQAIEIWLDQGITRAMDFANPSNPSG